MPVEIFTSANLAYLPQASVLAESVRKHEPSATITLLLVDEMPDPSSVAGCRLNGELFDSVLTARELLGEYHRTWMFGYDVVEACTALKGRALVRLLKRGSPVIYLDPDTALFGPLEAFVDALASASVLLTPHQLEPVPADDPAVNDEICTLAHGIFNFGMFGVSPTEEGIRFADWWADRLETLCIDDIPRGLFVDQRWGDLVPSFFPRFGIFRGAGVNFASWNMHQRMLTLTSAGEYQVNGDPLVMYHFTKGQGIGFDISKLKIKGNPLVADLWRWYLERLESFAGGLEPARWAYGYFDDGMPIAASDRLAFRMLSPVDRPNDPFHRSDQIGSVAP